MPRRLQIVIAFFFGLSACHLIALLADCVTALEIREQLLLKVILRGLISLLSLLLGIQLLIRVPFSRGCALTLLLAYPAAKAAHYVVAPLAWQITGPSGRFYELFSAFVFLAMAFFLVQGPVADYLRAEPVESAASPELAGRPAAPEPPAQKTP